jgi:prepilin-type N-terminal cleavage/methylation domain-containing protein
MRRNVRGFTLVELLVVAFIIGLAVAILAPRMNAGFLEGGRLRAAGNHLASIITATRGRAAATNTAQVLYLDLMNGKYWVVAQAARNGNVPDDSSISLDGSLPEGVQFADADLPGDMSVSSRTVQLRFTPEGWGDYAAIHLTGAGGDAYTVRIADLCGRVETWDGRVGLDAEAPIANASM